MTPQIDDFITREEAGTLAGCSPDTIKRDEKAHNLTTKVAPGGQKLIRLGDLIDCGRISRSVLEPGMTASDSAALKCARAELERLAIRYAKLEGQLEESKVAFTDLRGQLKSKDHQINELLATVSAILASGTRIAA